MENNFGLEDRETFRINPQVWLQTLLAIAGDREKKGEVLRAVSQQTGYSLEQAEVVMTTTIKILLDQTRSN